MSEPILIRDGGECKLPLVFNAGDAGVEYRSLVKFPGYVIGDDGSVWSAWGQRPLGRRKGTKSVLTTSWHRLSTPIGSRGYPQVSMRGGDGQMVYGIRLHQIVLEAFLCPKPEGMECCHADGNRANCCLSNLRWDTRRGNLADRDKHGTSNRGERNHFSKLSAGQVLEIRSIHASTNATSSDIAKRFGVSPKHVRKIIRRDLWSHI